MTEGGLAAFRVAEDGAITQAWRATLGDGSVDLWGSTECQWGGVALYDLDDDGRPEILFEGAVWDAGGVRVTTLPGWSHVGTGTPTPVGDFDGDGRVEAVAGHATWDLDPSARTFAIESGFSTTVPAGHVAVADLGDFPGVPGDAPGLPEVVSAGGRRRLRARAHRRADRVVPHHHQRQRWAADHRGLRRRRRARDRRRVRGSYEVIDLGEPSRRLWVRPSQDLSSSRTGSSVFDFNADGRAEVVYGDECFVRVYEGATGEVIFSQARFSSTWTENPIVADADGDGSAEMVMGASSPCSRPYCPEFDPIFAGLRCDAPEDCPSGACDAGYCRCTDDAGCGATYGCTAPLDGTPGSGNVCRAFHRDCVAGVRVYRDARDRWAASRTIWNQHAYHVTNVEESGVVPRTSAVRANWADATLNNFRQNVQGSLGETPGPDLTIQSIVAVCGGPDSTDMRATICNRGVVFLDAGIPGRLRSDRRGRRAHPPLRSAHHRARRARRVHDGELHGARAGRRRLRGHGRRRGAHRRVPRGQQQRAQHGELPRVTPLR
ncbi:MAG: VCBS repeat-containing protein [Sandaracinaceae bacterium]|nr:VCBS repeat-containing protein [Sandaracinaceae bacterium]